MRRKSRENQDNWSIISMEFERYEDVIDAFERDNMGYPTLTDYIKGENMKSTDLIC